MSNKQPPVKYPKLPIWGNKKAKFIQETKENLKLTIPLAIAQVSQSLMLLIDILMMAWVGSEAVGAGSLGNITIRFFLSVGICLACPVGIFIAAARGKEDYQKIKTVTAQGFFLIAIYTVLVILFLANEGAVLSLFGPVNESQRATLSYVHTVLFGFPAAMTFLLLQNILISLGKPRIITITLIISIFLNATLNPLFVFGAKMGLVGIALATTIVFWLQLIIVLTYMMRSPEIRTYKIFSQLFKFHWPTFKDVIMLGWPIGLQVMVEMGFLVLVGYIASDLGSLSFDAFEAAEQAPLLLGLVFISIEQATTTRVAYYSGQNYSRELRQAGLVGIGLGILFAIIVALIFIAKAHLILTYYIHPHSDFDRLVVDKASVIIRIIALSQIVDAMRIIACGALRGIKDTLYPLLVICFCYGVLGLALSYLTVHILQGGANALAFTIFACSLVSGLILLRRYLKKTNHSFGGELAT